jgi:hypothetical protein
VTTTAHLHPDHSCVACLAEENAERVGHEPSEAALHPDYVPPPPPARRSYTFVGGPLHGRQRMSRVHPTPDWRTATGQPTAAGHPSWIDRRYEADHEAALYRWRPSAPEARYRYEGGPLHGHSFIVGNGAVVTAWRTAEGCPIEREDPEVEAYYVLDRGSRTYRACPSAGSGSVS